MATRELNQAAIDLIKSFENLELVAYRCEAGVPSIGYGHTETVSGDDVGKKTITEEEAERLLRLDLREAQTRLAACMPADRLASLTDNQYGALVSFAFNAGASPSWVVFRLIREGRLTEVPTQLRRFIWVTKKGAKVRSNGLIRRREAEVALYLRA